jgi:Na+/melibiose symporter-like transporter
LFRRIAVSQSRYGLFYGVLIAAILLTIFLKDVSRCDHAHSFFMVIVIMTVIFVLYIKKLYRSIESDQRQMNALLTQ